MNGESMQLEETDTGVIVGVERGGVEEELSDEADDDGNEDEG
jgi:hypothetical protein